MRRVLSVALVLMMILVGCGNQNSSANQNEDDRAGVKIAKVGDRGGLPPYEYPGPELFYSVLYQYIIDEFGKNYESADVAIPCPLIVAMDESDKSDIKVWADFELYNYRLNNDILDCISGGSHPGCMHLDGSGDGYKVTGFEAVEDGSDYDSSAKEIFGDHYEEFINIKADEDYCKNIRAQVIANYSDVNNLELKAFQDYGQDPVELPEPNIDNFYGPLD
ncbi:MAG: hypothetical protein K6D38_03265 [Pseudobutyrivibrio sp.]|nr:hypothetical protein [Pseudobutyrivibrio sp.]